jgi:hypothetical protein
LRGTKVLHNRFEAEHGHVRDRTVGDDQFRRWSGGRVPQMRLKDGDRGFAGRPELRGNELHVFRPPVVRGAPPAPPQNRPPAEVHGYPGGFPKEREELIRRQRGEEQQLQQLHQRELQAQPKQQEPLLYRHQQERTRMEDEHNREICQLERRYPGNERVPY